jgi:hypothetical protein
VQGEIRDDAPTGLSPLREALPALDRSAPDEVDKPIAPPRAPPPKIERMPVPLSEPVVRETPPPAPPVERISPPLVEREIAPAVEPPSRELPFPVPPAPVEPPPPVVREVMPAVEPIVAPPIDIPPRKAPPETSASPQRAVPGVEREAPPPAAPLPRSAPADVAPRADRVVPPAAVAPRVDPVAPPAAAPVSAAPPAPVRTESPAVPPPPRLRFGAPGPGEEITEPRGDAVAPAPEPRVAPRIDLDASRQRAREITSDGGSYRGAVPIMAPPPPVDRKSKLSEAIEKALKPDCRDAYASMGLLAVPALVASAGGNGGCRW